MVLRTQDGQPKSPGVVVVLEPGVGQISGEKNWSSVDLPACPEDIVMRLREASIREYNSQYQDAHPKNGELSAQIVDHELAYRMHSTVIIYFRFFHKGAF